MILWKKFNEENLENIFNSIGIDNTSRVDLGDKYFEYVKSKDILVYVRFKYDSANFEPKLACISKMGNKYSLHIHGMQGSVQVSHYSQLNLPSL